MAVDKPTATAAEVATHRDSQQKEYGAYVALSPISYNGSLAYLAGDPVPASNVEAHGYLTDGLVAKQESKQAQELVAGIHAKTTATTVAEVPAPVSLNAPVK